MEIRWFALLPSTRLHYPQQPSAQTPTRPRTFIESTTVIFLCNSFFLAKQYMP
jgi:hypothetical protein